MQRGLRGGLKRYMINREEAENIVSTSLDETRLRKIIRNTSVVAWKNEISDGQVEKWLQNFNGSFFADVINERKLALWLLAHFTYYTYGDVRFLCKNLFNKYLHIKLKNCDDSNLEDKIKEIIQETVFVGLGNDSESGNNILYYFRQENQLSKKRFEISADKIYKNLVYIDDVTMSGEQAADYIKSRNLKADNTYVAIMIASDGVETSLHDEGLSVEVISSMTLDEREKAFSESAYVFSDKRIVKIKPIAKEFCEYYGKVAMQGWGYMCKHPLGYKDGQYLFGFEYNTPDNTLPIFWGSNEEWCPLFKRYQKIYEEEEKKLDGRKYY